MIGSGQIVTKGLKLSLDAGDKNSYDGSGNTWYDLCGNYNTTNYGATFNSNGYFVLDGTNDYFQVLANGSSDFNKQAFTVEFWCNVDPNNGYDVLWSYDYTSHSAPYYAQHFRATDTDGILFKLYGGTNKDGTFQAHEDVQYTPSKWTQLIWTISDGGSSKTSTFYQDGVSIGAQTTTSWNDITYYSQEVWIGKANFSTSFYKGSIAIVKFYDRALSVKEIDQNFNAQRTRFGV